MWRYIELLSTASPEAIAHWRRDVANGRNPRDIKVTFAQEMVARFHGQVAAEKALADFEARFREGALPEQMPEVELHAPSGGLSLPQVLKQAGLTASTSEALRMIEQGGVKLNGERVSEKTLTLARDAQVVLQVGKRKFARVKIC
jgi:tyrosyl-tRNA synthetase